MRVNKFFGIDPIYVWWRSWCLIGLPWKPVCKKSDPMTSRLASKRHKVYTWAGAYLLELTCKGSFSSIPTRILDIYMQGPNKILLSLKRHLYYYLRWHKWSNMSLCKKNKPPSKKKKNIYHFSHITNPPEFE